MNPEDIFEKEFIDPPDLEELCKTRTGRLAFLAWVQRERVAAGLAEAMNEGLITMLPKEQQEKLVWIIWRRVMGNVPVSEIMEQLKESREVLERYSLTAHWSLLADVDKGCGNA